jgi:quercetin dioxygenase-like cupin family protein
MVSMTTPTIKPYARSRSTDASAWYRGNTLVTFLATGEDTDGQFALMEFQGRKGNEPPPHVHQDEDECFYVVAGEVSFRVDGQTFHGCPGSWVVVPRRTVHSFVFDSDEATMLVLFTPAGFERFFQEMSEPATSVTTPPVPASPPDVPRLLATAAKHGSTFVAPS